MKALEVALGNSKADAPIKGFGLEAVAPQKSDRSKAAWVETA
jgi:hypothetical protein